MANYSIVPDSRNQYRLRVYVGKELIGEITSNPDQRYSAQYTPSSYGPDRATAQEAAEDLILKRAQEKEVHDRSNAAMLGAMLDRGNAKIHALPQPTQVRSASGRWLSID